ncbi:DUF59 domain-containing protein [Amycolatopsis sp. K13G38]|uniref:50S ribosomal protein L22 n=1 Tax=Amycolatopsis acididurans TaxID=2724524 RepID=A0ABX1JD29_9PSEU|nr:iron-sulfur cluster assembly protein [Amycolatopsis acididurans]NKQ57690.1 DUF59 domain-containing protein [Amycolatopsis acididurans]
MTSLLKAVDITVREQQLRVTRDDASAALERVLGEPAGQARARLRFGPGRTCEPLARMLDRALAQAEECGLASDALVLAAGFAVPAEDIVRIRRKAHGVADWISSPTSDVELVLRPKGLAAVPQAGPAAAPMTAQAARGERVRERAPDTEAERAVREALYDVIDPDLGVNVVDMGFVRQVRIDDDGVATITMTLTSAACPLTEVMERNVKAVLAESGTEFVLVWEWLPSWRPGDISADGREQLRAIGFSAF